MDENKGVEMETGTAVAEQAAAPAAVVAASGTDTKSRFRQILDEVFGGKAEEEPAGGANTGEKVGAAKESTAAFSEAQVLERIAAERAKWEAGQKQLAAKSAAGTEGEPDLKAEIEQLKADGLRKELNAKAMGQLSKDGFSTGLAGLMDFSSEEKFAESYARVTGVYAADLTNGIREALKAKTPEGLGSGSATASVATHAQIAANIRGQ